MEHEIYLALVDLNEKLEYIAEILMNKGIIPKPKKKKEGEEDAKESS